MLEKLWMKKTESIVLCLMACFSVDICVCVCVCVCVFWRGLCWFLIAACGLFSSCGTRTPKCMGSVVAAWGLSCPTTCGILVSCPGIEPAPPTLEGVFLTTDHQESPWTLLLWLWFYIELVTSLLFFSILYISISWCFIIY